MWCSSICYAEPVLVLWGVALGLLLAETNSGPAKLSYATYLPGPSVRYSALDSTGAMYVSGPSYPECPSRNFATVSKLKPDGSALLWTRCFEGTLGGIAVDRAGMLYVANNSAGSAALSKFDNDASKVIYSTTIPNATTTAIAVDHTGNVFLIGSVIRSLLVTSSGNLTCNFDLLRISRPHRAGWRHRSRPVDGRRFGYSGRR